MSDVMVI